jgi:tRNA pseudouridine38-40 synthase
MPCVFDRRFVTVMPEKLDITAIKKAAALLEGEHDFSAFCAAKSKKKSTVRQVYTIAIHRRGEEVQFDFTGNGFLYNMVRIMVGTLVEVGMGLRTPESVTDLFGASRAEAGRLMPAQGLCLMEVTY